jgi:hypothetical protein
VEKKKLKNNSKGKKKVKGRLTKTKITLLKVTFPGEITGTVKVKYSLKIFLA